MMTSGSPVLSSVKNKQVALILISLMMFAQFVILIPSVGADSPGTPTLRTTFSDGNEEILLDFDGFTFNQNAALEIPQNTTVDALSFSVEYHPDTMPSPGSVWLDIDQDGIVEWKFGDVGYGNLGNQTQFSDDSTVFSSSLSDGMNSGPDIIIPQNTSIANSLLSIDYVPENNGRWINESTIIDIATLNYDDDSLDEVIVLSDSQDTGNGDFLPAIGWINNNSNNDGYTDISWHETCVFAEFLEVSDFNGDGYDDVIVWMPSVGRFCYHLWDPLQNTFSASNELTGGTMGEDVFLIATDINGDGYGDVVFADTSGKFGYHQWKQNINGFELIGDWEYETTVSGNTQIAGIEQFDVGNILSGNPGTLVFVSDESTLDVLIWDPGSLEFIYLFPTFDNMDTDFLWLADINGDTFDEIVTWGTGTSGNILISDMNTNTYGIAPQSGLEAPAKATVVDYDGDGGLEVLIPESTTGDNNDTTMNGSLLVYNLFTGVLTDSTRTLTPRTMPSLTTAGDMNGDGHSEIIAYCGEVNKGIFIDSWHKMSYDFDSDGYSELEMEGFGQAESGPNGSQVFRISDINGVIANTIDMNSDDFYNYSDSYGINMMRANSSINLLTEGTVTLTNLRITYSFDHLIEDLYDGSGNNLSTLINNDYMEFGSQNFTIPLVFNATEDGELMLKNLHLITHPGHPLLPDLEPLVLLATNVLEDSVELRWSEVSTGSQYFSTYELYRTSVENGTFPADYSLLVTTPTHTDVSHIDTAVSEGGHYEYVVRSAFSVGGLYGALSNVIVIDLPSIPRVENVTTMDTPMDQGGSVDISWDEVNDRYTGYYNLFVLTENFTDTTLMDPITTLENTETTYTASYTSAVRNSSGAGDIITQAEAIVNEQALWVAVVATNESGSNPFVNAAGPVYALNNDLRPTQLTIELSTPTIFGSPVNENLIVSGGSPTVISLHLAFVDTTPLEGAEIDTTIIVDPNGDAYEFNFSSITDSQGDATIEFNWRDLANESIGVNGGGVEITAVYSGRAETLEKGPLEGSDESIDAMVVVPAYFSLNTPSVMVDEYGDATLEVSLIAEHDWQQAGLLNTDITFKYYLDDTLTGTVSQPIVNLDGTLDVFIDAMPAGGYVLITPDNSANSNNPAAWKYVNNFELTATLFEYDGSGQTNLDQDADGVIDSEDNCLNTPQGEVDEVEMSGANKGCSPSQIEQQIEIIDPTLECPVTEWTIENVAQSQNANRECLLINPNGDNLYINIENIPFKITIDGIEIGVNCGLSYIPAESNVTCVFSPTVVNQINKSTDDPILSNAVADFQFSWLNQNADTQYKDLSYSLEYYLIGNKTTAVDDNTDNSDNSGTDPVINEESADSKAGILDDPLMLGLIAGGGLIALISIVIIVRFIRGDDDDWDDDWDDDDDDDDMENPLDRILGRTSGGGYGSSEPQEEKEDRFERTLSRGRLSGAAGEEFVKQSQQSNDYENDPGYSIDEDGTEWWEDEQGQWWYRDPNMDDWEEWNE